MHHGKSAIIILRDRKTLKSASFEDGVLKFAKRDAALNQKPKLVS